MSTGLARTLLAALLSGLLVCSAALADADPASDVLLGENVFYPYSPPVSASVEKALNAETASAARAHFPIKVALIGSPVDLGAIPVLFGKPQQYAKFLGQEISFNGPQPLLVVMPSGYGVSGLDPAATSAAASLAKPAGSQSDDLARAAIAAVARLAAASGHPIAGVAATGASGANGSGSSVLAVAIIALVAVVTAGALVALRRRGLGHRRHGEATPATRHRGRERSRGRHRSRS